MSSQGGKRFKVYALRGASVRAGRVSFGARAQLVGAFDTVAGMERWLALQGLEYRVTDLDVPGPWGQIWALRPNRSPLQHSLDELDVPVDDALEFVEWSGYRLSYIGIGGLRLTKQARRKDGLHGNRRDVR